MNNLIRYNTVHHQTQVCINDNTVQYNTIQCSSIQFNKVCQTSPYRNNDFCDCLGITPTLPT